jgi:hypothetical protein
MLKWLHNMTGRSDRPDTAQLASAALAWRYLALARSR